MVARVPAVVQHHHDGPGAPGSETGVTGPWDQSGPDQPVSQESNGRYDDPDKNGGSSDFSKQVLEYSYFPTGLLLKFGCIKTIFVIFAEITQPLDYKRMNVYGARLLNVLPLASD